MPLTWKEKIDLLEKELTFKHFFDVLCLDKEQTFAIWLENGKEMTYNYDTLQNRSFSCAENIIKMSFGSCGKWTGIAVDTCPEWPILFWGLLSSGRNPLLLDPSFDDSGIEHLMKQTKSTSLITRRKRNLPYVQKTPEDVLGEKEQPSPSFEPSWTDLTAACTSGTTGTSRVYVYNGEAICRQVIGFSQHQPYPCFTCEAEGPVRTVSFLPLNHIFGLLTNVITTPFQNYPQIYLKDRSPKTILETCRKCKAQMILTVPLLVNSISSTIQKRVSEQSAFKRFGFKFLQFVSLLCQRIDPRWGLMVGKKLFSSVNENLFGDSMNQIVVGGAHVSNEHLRVVNSLGYAVSVGFGMTETAITSYENKIDLKTRMSGSVGLPLPISEYKVIPNGDDENRGELLIKSNAMHIGRLAEGILLPPQINKDGWFHTGDVVRIGNKGRMWIEGRIKDVIIGESGENVYPDEIEDSFSAIEGVVQYAVVGVKRETTEQIALVMNIGDKYNDGGFVRSLASTVEKRLQSIRPLKRPSIILITSEPLPIVNTIKVKRAEISKRIENGTLTCKPLNGLTDTVETVAEKPDAMPSEEIKKRIKRCIAEELEIDINDIKDDSSLMDDLGGDSLHRLGALLRVENEFDVRIPENAYEFCATINDLANVIQSLIKQK